MNRLWAVPGVLLGLLCGCGSSSPSSSGVAVSNTTYSFGTVVLNASTPISANRSVVQVLNNSGSAVAVTATLSGSPAFALQPSLSCGASAPTLSKGSNCVYVVAFTPTAAGSFTGQLNLQTTGGASFTQTIPLTGTATLLQQGQSLITPTDNPQVALYSWFPPAAGTVSIAFGPTATYAEHTNSIAATGTAPVSMYVAGMLQSTQYHLQAQLQSAAGQINDTDHTFTTGAWPAVSLPSVTVSTPTPGLTPSPGLEITDVVDTTHNTDLPLYINDLKGNLLWAYRMRDTQASTTIAQAPRQLPNGDFIFEQSPASQDAITQSNFLVNDLREVDFAGNIVRSLTAAQLTTALAANGFPNLNIQTLHHEVQVLPNGHILVLGNILNSISGLTGYTAPVNVLGDVLIDLDPTWKPVWVWNAFNYLDPNYHPAMGTYPDWTHCNAIQYEATDGNILLSCRHLSWILKINYANGTGNGAVMYKIGNNGDFTLQDGNAPIDWQYAQHYPHIISPVSAGIYQMVMVDNGDYRMSTPTTQVCEGQPNSGPSCYTTIPVYTVNEAAKTVTVAWRHILPAANYSFFGGEAQQLANGDIEYTLSTQPNATSTETEVSYDSNQSVVWQQTINNQQAYRGGRITGLYPGVDW